GDHDAVVAQIRQVLLREGQDCPASNVVPLERAAERLTQIQPELVVLTLAPDPERALTVLATLRGKVQARMLVVGPPSDTKLVLRTLRSGADDYVDESELAAELESALSRLRAELAARIALSGRVLAVLAPSGGSGSSTVAANLATVLAKEHKSAALFDLKLE